MTDVRFLAPLAALALIAASPARTATPPAGIAVFGFELEDYSAGSASAGEIAPADARELVQVTDEVGRLLAGSGRYRLVDTGAAGPPAAQPLHDCGGCDAGLALKLGADQSLVGVVRRISRTEYLVRLQIRDARSGAVLTDANTGLRMGTLDSWSKGAARLVRDRVLGQPD